MGVKQPNNFNENCCWASEKIVMEIVAGRSKLLGVFLLGRGRLGACSPPLLGLELSHIYYYRIYIYTYIVQLIHFLRYIVVNMKCFYELLVWNMMIMMGEVEWWKARWAGC